MLPRTKLNSQSRFQFFLSHEEWIFLGISTLLRALIERREDEGKIKY